MNSRLIAFLVVLLVLLAGWVAWVHEPSSAELPSPTKVVEPVGPKRSDATTTRPATDESTPLALQPKDDTRVAVPGPALEVPSRTLRVTDLDGAPLAGAELAIVASRDECLLHLKADPAGVIEIAGDAPKGKWYASAPGMDILQVQTTAESVQLAPALRVLVSAVDSVQGQAVEALPVRPVFGGDAPGCFEWVASREDWQRLDRNGTVFLMRERSEGTLSLHFDCDLAGPCDLWIDSWYLESRPPADPQRADEDLVLFVDPHTAHKLPQIVFRDAFDQPVVDARVLMKWDDLTLREMVTDASGAILINLHVLDELSPLPPFRLQLTTADGHEWTSFVTPWNLRKQGLIVIYLEPALVEVRLTASDPTAFAAAILNEDPEFHQHAAGRMSLEALEFHGGQEFLPFIPFAPDGSLELDGAGERGDRCVLIQHRESGMLVAGSCFVEAGSRIRLTAPSIGQIEYRGRLAETADWSLEYFDPRAPKGRMSALPPAGVELQGPRQTFSLPYGTYRQLLTFKGHQMDGTELTVDRPLVIVEPDLPELITIHGRLRTTLAAGARLDWCFVEAGLDNQSWAQLDAAGEFQFEMPADLDRELVWMSATPGAKPTQRVVPVWLDATHVEVDFGLAQLDLQLAGSADLFPFFEFEFVATDGSYYTESADTDGRALRTVILPAGEYKVSLGSLDWTQTVTLQPGEWLTVDVPAFPKGLVTLNYEAPQWTQIYIEVYRGERVEGDGDLQLLSFVNHIAPKPEFVSLDPGRYTFVLHATSDLPNGQSAAAEVTKAFEVQQGKVTNAIFELNDLLRESAR